MQGVIECAARAFGIGRAPAPEQARLGRRRLIGPHGHRLAGLTGRCQLDRQVCLRHQPQGHPRRIVRGQRARHPRCLVIGPLRLRRSSHAPCLPVVTGCGCDRWLPAHAGFGPGGGLCCIRTGRRRLQGRQDLGLADVTGTQHHRPPTRQVDDGRFQTDAGRPAFQHQRHGRAQITAHMRRATGADATEAVGRGRRQTGDAMRAQGLHQRGKDRMRGDAHGDGGLTTAGVGGRIGLARQHQGQRPRPEGFGQPLRLRVPLRPVTGLVDAGDVDDQRMIGRPALDAVDARHRRGIGRIAGQTVDGFGGQADDAALAQDLDGGLQGLLGDQRFIASRPGPGDGRQLIAPMAGGDRA